MNPVSFSGRVLAAIPVHNERNRLREVLLATRAQIPEVLVVDDGSTDESGAAARSVPGVRLLSHERNLGYGRSLRDAFAVAIAEGYDAVVTVDADGQHEPREIPRFLETLASCDIASGTRYPEGGPGGPSAGGAPPDRVKINRILTRRINGLTGLRLTDAFCGLKAYRTAALARLDLTEDGYAMPVELWIQAAARGLRVREVPTSLIYRDANRRFGGGLDDPRARLRYYGSVLRLAARRAGRARRPACRSC